MRRLFLTILCLPGLVLGAAADARAGQVVFSSNRCEGPEDLQQRREPFGPPGGAPRCRRAIWQVNDDGSGLRRLTDGGTDVLGRDTEPTWSPDGLSIAYTSAGGEFGGDSRIFVVNADGSGRRRLTSAGPPEGGGGAYSESAPDWSPEGTRVLFTTRGSGSLFTHGIDVASIVDGSVSKVVDLPGWEARPQWSSDGLRILFGHHYSEALPGVYGDPAPDSGLYSVPGLGGPARRLSIGNVPIREGLFSPDESQIAFEMFFTTWTARASGADLRQRSFGLGQIDPTWADGSSALIYPLTATDGPQSVLARLELRDGASPIAITDGEGYDLAPDWHPGPGIALPPPVEDAVAPVVQMIDGKTRKPVASVRPPRGARRATATVAPTRVKAGNLRYLALDASGVRRVEAAISVRRAGRCRFMGRRRLGRPRRCSNPVWFGVTGPRAWRARVGRLPRGTYTVRFRTLDVRGNRRSVRPVVVRIVR